MEHTNCVMKMDWEESAKQEELQMILKEWIGGDKNMNYYLLDFRRTNGTELVDREVVLSVLREDMLQLIDLNQIVMLLSFETNGKKAFNSSSSLNSIQEALKQLMESMKNQIKPKGSWEKHLKLCAVIQQVLRKFKKSLNQQTCDRMFDYLMNLIETCENREMIDCALDALTEFLFDDDHLFHFDKYRLALHKLIDFPEKCHNQNILYEKYLKLCYVIKGALRYCKHTLSHESCKKIFNLCLSLIKQYKDVKEMVVKVFSAVYSFPFSKYQYSLMQLIELLESELLNSEMAQMNECALERYNGLCEIIQLVLEECADNSLSHQICERMIEYLVKLIEKCNDKDTIYFVWESLAQFPFVNHQTSLLQLINLVENRFTEVLCGYDKHEAFLCEILTKMLRMFGDSLNRATIDRIFDYLIKLIERCENVESIDTRVWFALRRFPFDKNQSSLLQLIDLAENQWNECKNVKLCTIAECTFYSCKDSSSLQTCDQLFNYLKNLIEKCDNRETVDCAWKALKDFPFDKLISFESDKCQVELEKFVVFPKSNLLETEQNNKILYDKIGYMNKMLKWAVDNCEHLLNQDSLDRIFYFYFNLIKQHEDRKMIEKVFSAMFLFPFVNYQSSLLQLIDTMESQLNGEKTEWYKHWKWFNVMSMKLFVECKHSLSQQACNRMFDYLMKLIDKCDDKKTIDRAWEVLRLFPFDKYQSSLLLLIDTMDNQLNEQQWVIHGKLCELIGRLLNDCAMLKEPQRFNQQIYDIMFDYLMKLIEKCEADQETIDFAWDALTLFPFHLHQSLLLQLIVWLENKLNEEEQSDKHGKLCIVIYMVLWRYKADLSEQTLGRMYDYIMKLFDKCRNDDKTIEQAWYVLEVFPFDQYQSWLFNLIDSVEGNFYEKVEWHIQLCKVVKVVLSKFKKSLNQQTLDRMFDYVIRIIDREKTIDDLVWNTLKEYPFDLCQSALLKLIYSVESQLNEQQEEWKNHAKLCELTKHLMEQYKDSLTQLVYCRMFDYLIKLIDKCDDDPDSFALAALSHLPINQIQSSLMRVYQSIMNDLHSPQQHNWKMHQNWCRVIEQLSTALMLNYYSDLTMFNQGFLNLLFDYFIRFFDICDHMATVLPFILLIEKLAFKRVFGSDQKKLLKDKLVQLFCLSQECPFDGGLPDEFDFVRYQVEWCARWCVDKVVGRDEQLDKFPLVKLSPSQFGARNDGIEKYVPVCSQLAVETGAHYYEAIILTTGKMIFGWSSRRKLVSIVSWTLDSGAAEDEVDVQLAIGFDTQQKCILLRGKQVSTPLKEDCREGDVIGCLIDFDQERFVFYYNGQPLEYCSKVYFSVSLYYPTARLSLNQQCHFNFGQAPFSKFAPDGAQFGDFHEASGKYVRKYQLAETCEIGNAYWFKHSTVDNRVELLYCDQTQGKCDVVMRAVEEDIRNDRDIFGEDRFRNVKIERGWKAVRYIQSIIEVMGGVIGENNVDVMAQWIGKLMEGEIDAMREEKLLELFYPYLQLEINSPKDVAKHRSISIVLAHLIKLSKNFYLNFIDDIRSEVFAYLTRTLTSTTDQWTQLFVLIALDSLELSEADKYALQVDYRIMQLLNNCKNQLKAVDYLSSLCTFSISYQCHFICEHFLSHVLNGHSQLSRVNPAALNANNRTECLKLSHDYYSARSDWKWQSVSSVCEAKNGIYYYETTLLTNGPKRIGWSTKLTELAKTEVGGDLFSIGFDGYNRCVWHNGAKLPLESSLARPWKAADVIGCLIEVIKNRENNEKEKRFSFYLNGRLMPYKALQPIYSSTHPYHASISLSAHQQVYLNFGQTKFSKYAPRKDYLSFHHHAQEAANQKGPISMSNITNAVISIESTNSMGNVSMSYQKVMTSSIIDNILKKGLTTECITCPVCYRKIYLIHFFRDCCECLKLTLERSATENELRAITSTEQSADNQSNKRKLPNDEFEYKHENNKISAKQIKSSKCQLCQKELSTKRVRFECCDHLKFCLQCGLDMNDCPKCKRMPSTSVTDESVTQQSIECQYCGKIIESRALQFVDCDHGKMCRDCVGLIIDCPKCKK